MKEVLEAIKTRRADEASCVGSLFKPRALCISRVEKNPMPLDHKYTHKTRLIVDVTQSFNEDQFDRCDKMAKRRIMQFLYGNLHADLGHVIWCLESKDVDNQLSEEIQSLKDLAVKFTS